VAGGSTLTTEHLAAYVGLAHGEPRRLARGRAAAGACRGR
jgi:hypothetical protein